MSICALISMLNWPFMLERCWWECSPPHFTYDKNVLKFSNKGFVCEIFAFLESFFPLNRVKATIIFAEMEFFIQISRILKM